MTRPARRTPLARSLPVFLAALSVACQVDDDVGSTANPAYVSVANAWPDPSNIPVCWETAGWQVGKEWVRAFVEDLYETVGDFEVDFTGWGQCTSGSDGIRVKISDEQPHTRGLGTEIDGTGNGMSLNFSFAQWDLTVPCVSSARRRAFCVGVIAAHEFAHALGVDHEQNRPDHPASCAPDGNDGDTMVGIWDIESLMNACNPRLNNEGVLSFGDIAGLTVLNPPPQRILNLFYTTANGHIQQVYRAGAWQTGDVTAWTGAPLASGSPSSHDHDRVLHVYYRSPGVGMLNQLLWTPSLGWRHTPLATPVPSAGNPASVGIQGYTHVFYRGTDNHLRQLFHDGVQFTPVDLTTSYGAPLMGSDPVVYTLANSVHVVYRGEDNRLQKFWWELDMGWTRDARVSNFAALGTPAVSQIGFTQSIYFLATDQHIYHLFNDYKAGTTWTSLNLSVVFGGNIKPASEPAVHSRSRLVNVFYRGVDNRLHELYFDPANTPPGQSVPVWVHTDLSQVVGGPPVLGRPSSVVTGTRQQVLYPSTNGVLNMMTGTSNGWTNTALGANVGAPAVTGVVATAVH